MKKGLVLLLACVGITFAQMPWGVNPPLVRDKGTAIKVAEVILFPLYGKETIEKERPYNVTLRNGYWYVSGSMPEGTEVHGGTFFITISERDGQVREIGHFK